MRRSSAGVARIRVLALVSASDFDIGSEPRYLRGDRASCRRPWWPMRWRFRSPTGSTKSGLWAAKGLQRMYIGTLTLALFLAVIGAVLLAVLLGNQLVRPLLVLAEGMREVALGNLAPKEELAARDELAGLTRTFARMTQDLSDARSAVQRSMQQVDASRENLQTILDNLTTGVAVLDPRTTCSA